MTGRDELTMRAEQLRTAFDSSFAKPVEQNLFATEDFLLLQLGPIHYAVRLSGISGLFVDRMVTRLPGSPAELMGLSGFRGTVLPVYDFQAVLGQGKAESPRWMMIVSAAPVALAFGRMLGHRRIASHDIRRDITDGSGSGQGQEFVPADDGQGHCAVVDLRGVIETIMRGIVETPKDGEA